MKQISTQTDTHKVLGYYSLIPGPFPPPVFDRLQITICKNRGGRPGRKSHVREAVTDRCNSQTLR